MSLVNNLDLITNVSKGNVYVGSSGNLEVKVDDEDGNTTVTTVTALSSHKAPILTSQLYSKLEDRSWNNPYKAVVVDGKLAILEEEPEMSHNPGYSSLPECGVYYAIKTYYLYTSGAWEVLNDPTDTQISGSSYTEEEPSDESTEGTVVYTMTPTPTIFPSQDTISKDDIETFISDYYTDKKEEMNDVNLYTSSKVSIDLLEGTISFNMIKSDEYTNIVNLVGLEGGLRGGMSCQVEMSVHYTLDGSVHGETLTFTAFECSEDSETVNINRENFVTTLGNVSVEYLDGIIRAVPVTEEIDECIINSCTVTYGNFSD